MGNLRLFALTVCCGWVAFTAETAFASASVRAAFQPGTKFPTVALTPEPTEINEALAVRLPWRDAFAWQLSTVTGSDANAIARYDRPVTAEQLTNLALDRIAPVERGTTVRAT